ncbi:MAG: hypothetical protein ACTHK5_02555 [Tsuneonella sp.]
MSSALSIDNRPGPPLPAGYRNRPAQQEQLPARHPSPLPDDWSDSTRPLRDLAKMIEKMFR